MNKAFAISDIHGDYKKFIELLDYWNPEESKLIIMGDLVDRGERSLYVVHKVMELKKVYKNKVIVLKGNHEDMFLNFLKYKDYEYGDIFFRNGGNTTSMEFADDEFLMFKSYEQRANIILEKRKEEVEFLRKMMYYYKFGNVLFVHAGVDPYISEWKNTENYKFLWNRNGWKHKNETGKVIVFGHTPTMHIHDDKRNDIWISKDKTYICVDGGSVFGGQLNGILIDNDGEVLNTYSIK